MIRQLLRFAIVAAFLLVSVAATAAAQDFQKTYHLPAGASIRVGNISGNVTVTGYDGSAIIVTATKEGADRDLVEIVDRSSGSSVDVGVQYPRNCNCNVDVQFQVQVPRSMSFDFRHI